MIALCLGACASPWVLPTSGRASSELSAWSAYGLALGEHHSFHEMEAHGLAYAGVNRGVVYWRSRARTADGAVLEVQTYFPQSAHAEVERPGGQDAAVLEVVSIRAEFRPTGPEKCADMIAGRADEMARANPMLSLKIVPGASGWSDRAIFTPADNPTGVNSRQIEMWCGQQSSVFYLLRRYPTDSLGDFIVSD